MSFTKNTWGCPLFPIQNSSWNVFIVGLKWHSNSKAKSVIMSPALTETCWMPLMDLSQLQGYWAVSVPWGSHWQDASASQNCMGWRMRGKAATPLLIYHQANKLSLIRDKARRHINPFKLFSWWSSYLFVVLQLIAVDVPVCVCASSAPLHVLPCTVYKFNINY